MTSKRVGDIYVDPLPYSLRPLPIIVVHNPLSVAHFLWVYFFGTHPTQVRVTATIEEGMAVVKDPVMMARLWSMGFFGKGTLSRSEPSWFGRTARRLGLDGGNMSFEEITEQRRKNRRRFKCQRAALERRELNKKLAAEGKSTLEELDEDGESEEDVPISIEEKNLVENDTIASLEVLQLMPCETIFLSVGLGVLDVVDKSILDLQQLVARFCSTQELFLKYVVYHYLRSLGWCVRSGVKFGTDFVVYKQGPPFQHAQFAVMILQADRDENRDWWWQQAVSRVVGGVRKSLVFCYVVGPDPDDLDLPKVTSIKSFRKALQQFKVQSVVYSRWAPTKTRD